MKGKHIVVGVTGSIAAYKAAEICSILTKRGVHIHVIMTRNACKLISPNTFYTLTRKPVQTRLFAKEGQFPPPHISLSELANLMLVAPATANIIAKMAGESARSGLGTLVVFMALLSLNLGILNLLPIPVLDGGHMLFLSIEGILRRSIPQKLKLIVQQVFMFLLLGFMLFVIYIDILRVIQK